MLGPNIKKFKVFKKNIAKNEKTFFIADIAANHDGSLSRAIKLIRLCAKNGADAAKFQHFKAETIVSDYGFKKLGKLTHQKKWKKTVFQTYKEASINNKWTPILKNECHKNGIAFMTSPYDLSFVKSTNKFVDAYKVGSGDINWHEIIIEIAKKKKPIMIACGASNIEEVKKIIGKVIKINDKIVLMQCNTNYTNSDSNFNFINLNTISSFKKIFKDKIILGLSDHTEGHTTVIGAVALGARVIEKHFTDDNNRIGPDHKFSMNPVSWNKMVFETRRLERALGDGKKKIEKNEKKTYLIQRRCVRAREFIQKNTIITRNLIEPLRPNVEGAVQPQDILKLLKKKTIINLKKGQELLWKNIKQ